MTKVSIFLRLADAAAITLVFALPLCLSVWREKKDYSFEISHGVVLCCFI